MEDGLAGTRRAATSCWGVGPGTLGQVSSAPFLLMRVCVPGCPHRWWHTRGIMQSGGKQHEGHIEHTTGGA